MKKIFCVEDDELFKRILEHKLSLNPEFSVTAFMNGKDLLERMVEEPDVVTLDINLPDMSGVELMERIRVASPSTQVIILSGEQDVQVASQLFKLGAYDYIVKNEKAMEHIWNVVHKATSHAQLDKEVKLLRHALNAQFNFSAEVKGASSVMSSVFSLVEKSLKTNINVMITGETGTGKELIAKTIHHNSAQKGKPFVAINVSAIPNELVESELFGYEKGAFTGANSSRIGQLEFVKGGTLFLDEIADMSLTMQTKLLRVLQEMEITRLGSNTRIPVEFRLITATHKDLLNEVKLGNFREDLYYRILGIRIDLPPLRNRGKDTLLLANHFIQQFARSNKIVPKKLSMSAVRALTNYSFPGNVRELRAVIETAFALSDGDLIGEKDLSLRDDDSLRSALDISELTLEEHVNRIIEASLRVNNNNVIQTAKKLGIGKSRIYSLIREGKIKTRNQ